MSEKLNESKLFEHNQHRECERKFLPVFPDRLQEFRPMAYPVEQYYLSHPNEPFSLRFRETLSHDGELTYSAALKDRGMMSSDGVLVRLEVETEISAELYKFYKSEEAAVLHKLRYQANTDVVIDYYDDGHVQLESENDLSLREFVTGLETSLVDVTGDRVADNEWRAHLGFRKSHNGTETLTVAPDISVEGVVDTLTRMAALHPPVVARICGRSGSGKSTIVREIQHTLQSAGLESIVLSTDDYHRGATWLKEHNKGQEWSEWDHPIVYDTAALQLDLERLLRGETIDRRTIDFTEAEPVLIGRLESAPIVLIEGIYAGVKEFEPLSQLTIDVPAPLATCIGRRLLRDMKERPEFANLQKSFIYMLEQAEPMWRKQAADHE